MSDRSRGATPWTAQGLLWPARRFLVAAEMEAPDAPRAHAVGDLGPATARHGIAMCGLPADELVVVPSLDWAQVERASRCPICQDQSSGSG